MPAYANVARVTRREIRAFDREARQLVADFHRAGWRSYLSRQGHAIMLAPDGRTTASVSGHTKGRQAHLTKMARADLKRWQRAQGQGMMQTPDEIPNAQEETPVATATVLDRPADATDSLSCSICGKGPFPHKGALALHRTTHDDPIPCPIPGCPRVIRGTGAVAMHLKRSHGDGTPAHNTPTSKRRKCPVPSCGTISTPQGMGQHLKMHLRRGDVTDGQILTALHLPDVEPEAARKPAPVVEVAPAPVETVPPPTNGRPAFVAPGQPVKAAEVVRPEPESAPAAKPAPWSTPDPDLEAGAQIEVIRALVSASLVAEIAQLRQDNERLSAELSAAEHERDDMRAWLDLMPRNAPESA